MNFPLQDAIRRVLGDAAEPLHYSEITRRILDQGLSDSKSKTPSASINAVLSVDIKRNGASSHFVRIAPGVFGLRSKNDGVSAEDDTLERSERRVRIPSFPSYTEVRLVLPIWDGMPRSAVTGLHSTLGTLRGTPQEPVDWSSPDEWIPERLTGADREVAQAVWTGTDQQVNPRYVYGHWLLAISYGLLHEDDSGILHLAESGVEFLKSHRGKAEAALDEAEGLLKLLALVADSGPASFGEFVEGWGEYLSRRSRFGTASTIKDTLRRRLRNLLERGLLDRSGTQYTISEAGLAYLGRAGDEDASDGDAHQEIRKLVREQEATVRQSIRDLLADLDPYAFEDLDALRGCLHRFGAVRGTIIATSKYSRGTRDAAFEPGAAPITLIDGEKLIDLLITHGIGVRKKTLEVLDLDPEAFAEVEESMGEQGDEG